MAEAVRGDECPGDEDRTTSYLQILPNELWVYIFSFLNVRELCLRVAPVCTSWRHLSKDPVLRKYLVLDFHGRRVTRAHKRLVAASPLLISLEVHNLRRDSNFLLRVGASCKMLKELTLIHCDDISYAALHSFVTNCPNMRSFKLDNCSRLASRRYRLTSCFNDSRYLRRYRESNFYLIADFKYLQYLDLNSFSLLTDDDLEDIVRQCKHLEYLNIQDMSEIHDSSIILLTKELSHCLKSLHIHGHLITDMAYLSLGNLVLLEELTIWKCLKMSDFGLCGLSRLKNLTSLTLWFGDMVTQVGVTRLIVESLSQVVHLELGFQHFDDTLVSELAWCCRKLIKLNLMCLLPIDNFVNLILCTRLDMTDAGIAEVVTRCPLLQELSLTSMSKLTGTAFTNIPTALPHLRRLELWGCRRVNSSVLERLEEQMASLSVVHQTWTDWLNL